MKLLFDQNISARIVRLLETVFPDCTQVSLQGLYDSPDAKIWQFAKENDCCIVTFDRDFLDLLTLHNWPPKVILLRTGNRSTKELAALLKNRQGVIHHFLGTLDIGCLEIYL